MQNEIVTPEQPESEPLTETAALRLSLGHTDKVSPVFVFSIAMLSMLGPFTIDMIFPGFPQMSREFSADMAAMQQITSSYLLSFAVMSVFHGPLSDALGRKRVMTVALSVYTLAALGAALSPNLALVIVFRVLQGLSAGGATIISRVVIRDLYGGGRAQKLMSQVMMIFAIAPAIAPIIGGWLLYYLGQWRWIFAAMMAYALITLIVMLIKIPETLPAHKRLPFSARSLFASLRRTAASGTLWRLCIPLAASGSAHFVFISAAPVIVPELMHLGEQDYWVLFVPIIAGMISGSYLVGRLADVFSRLKLITAAFITSFTGAVVSVILTALAPELSAEFSAWHLIIMAGPLLLGLGSALMMAPLQLEALDLFPHARGAATSIMTFMNLVGAALISGLIVPLLAHSLEGLALGALGLTTVGGLAWGIHMLVRKRELRAS